MKIEREPPSQRRHYRITAPIKIIIDNKEYESVNWSISGISVKDFDEDDAKIDTVYNTTLKIDFQGFKISFDEKIKLLRIDKKNKTAAFIFIDLDERGQEILEYLSSAIISGKVAPFENILRKIDVPVTPASLKPGTSTSKESEYKRSLQQLCVSLGYIIMGGVVGFFLLKLMYSYFFNILVDTAVVAAPIEKIVSPGSGILVEYYVSVDQYFEEGEPLFKINDLNMTQQYQLAKIEAYRMENEVIYLENTLQAEEQKFNFYSLLAKYNKDTAEQTLADTQQQLILEKKHLERWKMLREKGAFSEHELETAQQDTLSKSKELAEDKLQLKIQQHIIKGVEKGLYFGSEKVESDISIVTNQLEKARRNLIAEEKIIKYWEEKISHLTLKAPFSGSVVKIVAIVGNPISFGKPVIFIESNQQREIHAYLTQEQVTKN